MAPMFRSSAAPAKPTRRRGVQHFGAISNYGTGKFLGHDARSLRAEHSEAEPFAPIRYPAAAPMPIGAHGQMDGQFVAEDPDHLNKLEPVEKRCMMSRTKMVFHSLVKATVDPPC